MIALHASQAFVKRFRCDVSLQDKPVAQSGGLYAWSAHVIRVGRSPVVLLMNDASLYTLTIPATGLTSYTGFVAIFLALVDNVWRYHGADFDREAHPVLVLRRTNRSLIGSMNDAVRTIRWYHEAWRDEGRKLDLAYVQSKINQTPYKALDYDDPNRRIARLLRGDPDYLA